MRTISSRVPSTVEPGVTGRNAPTTFVSRGAILLLTLIFLSSAYPQASLKPLSKDAVVKLLAGDVAPERIEAIVAERGIDFELTPDVEQDLRKAHATDALLTTIRKVQPPPFALRKVLTATAQNNTASSVSFSPDGNLLASGTWESAINLWDPNTEVLKDSLRSPTMSTAFSPDGHLLASGTSDGKVELWDTSNKTLRRTLLVPNAYVNPKERDAETGFSPHINSVAFSHNNQLLASANSWGEIDLWNVADWHLMHHFDIPFAEKKRWFSLFAIAFSPDDQFLVSGDGNGGITFWDVHTMTATKTLQGAPGLCLAFSPDGSLLAAGGTTLELWDMKTLALKQRLPAHVKTVWSVAFSPDGKFLASGGDLIVELWEVQTERLRETLSEHKHWVRAVAFSPDSRLLASGGASVISHGTDPSKPAESVENVGELILWARKY